MVLVVDVVVVVVAIQFLVFFQFGFINEFCHREKNSIRLSASLPY